jgi:hypothetical protein
MGTVFRPVKYTLFMGQPRPILDIITDFKSDGPLPSPSVTPTNTPTPSVTPTITVTPTFTSTPTPTVTVTNTSTPTPTVTPSPTQATPFDPDAALYLSDVIDAGGSVDATMSAATETLFLELKSNSLYDKLYTFYPMLGGVGASHSLNGKRSMGTTYDIEFFGGWVHDSTGALGNTTNTYGNTKYIPFDETTFSAFTFGFYNTNYTTVNGEYYNGSINNTSPQKWAAFRAQGTSTRLNIAESGGLTRNVDTGQQGLYIGTTTSGNTHSVCYNGVVGSANAVSGTLPSTAMYIGALNLDGSRYGSINMKYTFWFNSNVRLTSGEMTTLSTIINDYQTSLGRNTY